MTMLIIEIATTETRAARDSAPAVAARPWARSAASRYGMSVVLSASRAPLSSHHSGNVDVVYTVNIQRTARITGEKHARANRTAESSSHRQQPGCDDSQGSG